MKIAFLGIRGIPKGYSGFETFVKELAPRLAAKGHQVTVYGRSYHQKGMGPEYENVKLISLPTLRYKHFETILHTFLSVCHALFCRYDIVYMCIVGNAPLAVVPRLAGAKVFLNVDGADWSRDKWGGFASKYMHWCEKISKVTANVIIADAKVIQDRYNKLYNAPTTYIPYGGNIVHEDGIDSLEKYGVEKNKYVLFVSRLEPENRADLLIQAFGKINTDYKLVIIGDAPYADEYKSRLHELAGKNVIFTGFVFGNEYRQLSCGAHFFVLPSAVDGTRPVLLDQLGFGNCVLVCGTPANSEVVGDKGLTFDPINPLTSLTEKLNYLFDNPLVVQKYKDTATARIKEKYSWEAVTDSYDDLFRLTLSKND